MEGKNTIVCWASLPNKFDHLCYPIILLVIFQSTQKYMQSYHKNSKELPLGMRSASEEDNMD